MTFCGVALMVLWVWFLNTVFYIIIPHYNAVVGARSACVFQSGVGEMGGALKSVNHFPSYIES
jgi:hypothetical protein